MQPGLGTMLAVACSGLFPLRGCEPQNNNAHSSPAGSSVPGCVYALHVCLLLLDKHTVSTIIIPILQMKLRCREVHS